MSSNRFHGTSPWKGIRFTQGRSTTKDDRRAFEGDESDSAAADDFFRSTLTPLRANGATVLTLCHAPKTTGQQKIIADENMIRGSGDWLAQLDAFLVLRPVERHRVDPETETVSLRLIHAKARRGPQADPLPEPCSKPIPSPKSRQKPCARLW